MNIQNSTELAIKAKTIFEHALSLSTDARNSYLSEQCQGNEALLKECLALFENWCGDSTFLDNLHPYDVQQNHPTSLVGENFGVYRLNKKIGSGGMAEVYAATRTDGVHDKTVALKLLRGWGNVEQLISRFNQERKILAGLTHPNIARFIDGGVSEDGRPYYALEYVEGQHIDEYCNSNSLGIFQRLKLFLKVCSAVTHAHKHLVIHRDLKPGNILVTPEGEVKLLDFGIAKLLDGSENSDGLTIASSPMTPRYSSPEQIKHQALTTASDQYSLGVLLYELLSGQSPYGVEPTKNVPLSRAVLENKPCPPSQYKQESLKSYLNIQKGDLDTIALKTLEKMPEDRYDSVQALGEDIERYLKKEPIKARSSSLLYTGTRFLQRNWKIAGISCIALTLLFAQQWRVLVERDHALHQQKTTKEVQAFLISIFEIADPGESYGEIVTAREILDQGVLRIEDELQGQPETRAALLNTMGNVYRKLAIFEKSETLFNQAQTIFEESNFKNSIEHTELLNNFGELYYDMDNAEKSLLYFEKALAYMEAQPATTTDQFAYTLGFIGLAHGAAGNYDAASKFVNQSLTRYGDGVENQPLKLASLLTEFANLDNYFGHPELALDRLSRALLIARNNVGETHPLTVNIHASIGFVHITSGNFDEGLDKLELAKNTLVDIYGENHTKVAYALEYLGRAHYEMGDFDQGLEYYQQAFNIQIKYFGESHPAIARLYNSLSIAPIMKGDYESAVGYLKKSIAITINALGEQHPQLSDAYNNLANIYIRQQAFEEANILLYKALAIRLALHQETHPKIGDIYFNLAKIQWQTLDLDGAIGNYQKALNIFMEVYGENNLGEADVYRDLGLIYMDKKNYDLALDYENRALTIMQTTVESNSPALANILLNLGKIHSASDNQAEATTFIQKAYDIFSGTLGVDHKSTLEAKALLTN